MTVENMTPEVVRERVAAIQAITFDDEAAHSAEDALYRDVLRAIAESRVVDAQSCAIEALKADEIEFSRWCA